MGLFNRKPTTPTAPAEGRIPQPQEIASAARALAEGDCQPADALTADAGQHSRSVAMRILADSIDYTPQD
ncbi:hypothetical protein JJV70_19230 [Streptomyces sp. JJ66]|uniref:hypothetical protein n=1 Tax=Streptomyces sp. JJ66 TaxID=2803843 RepID=UPI001C58E892|nr:hypothetical protein [Streptomyces sp. JJ66]MBW1604193.1 hypothetical protein [Streptomyces sp. JJ66]